MSVRLRKFTPTSIEVGLLVRAYSDGFIKEIIAISGNMVTLRSVGKAHSGEIRKPKRVVISKVELTDLGKGPVLIPNGHKHIESYVCPLRWIQIQHCCNWCGEILIYTLNCPEIFQTTCNDHKGLI